MTSERPNPTLGAKMIFLIKRRAETSREELIAHWFANHMPGTIARQEQSRLAGGPHARRYICTLFDPRADKPHTWDGMAQVWMEQPPAAPATAHGMVPVDTFQEKVEPYGQWATREYVVMDGALPLNPQTLNPAFPCTRSGFFKLTFLIALKPGADCAGFFEHWLDVHIPNVCQTMDAVGGFRYVVSPSLEPAIEPYVGMAELYFPDASGWAAYRKHIKSDGMERWVDWGEMAVFYGGTEMVGIP
ncbi:MAG: EthD domain-containing protein [Alphaproteobacteria bacterium]